jgi:hypothetical protein
MDAIAEALNVPSLAADRSADNITTDCNLAKYPDSGAHSAGRGSELADTKDAVVGQEPSNLTTAKLLLRQHSYGPQPRLHQLRPGGSRKLCTPQSKPMAAFCIQMHLHENPGILQRNVVNE